MPGRGRRLRGLILAWKVFCYALGTLVLVVVAVQLWFFIHVLYWNYHEPAMSAFME